MSQTTVQLALGKQKIIEDIKVLLNDAEELVRLSATLPGEGVDAPRSRLRDHVDCTEKYVRENPWQSLGIAAGVGFLVGLIVSR